MLRVWWFTAILAIAIIKTANAVEFKVGGQYRIMINSGNFAWHSETISPKQSSDTFANQRFRTWLSLSTTEDVGVYMQMEMGNILWGEGMDFPKTYQIGEDRVGLELRRAFLRYNTNLGTFRVGIQDWHDLFCESEPMDSFEAVDDYGCFASPLANSIWDFNVAGVTITRKSEVLNLRAGWYSILAGTTKRIADVHLSSFDIDFSFKESSLGFGAYYIWDKGKYSYPLLDYESSWDLWLGIRGRTKILVPINAYFILNTGKRFKPDLKHTGFAGKLEIGGFSAGPSKLSAQVIYSSDDFRTIAQSERDELGAQGYWSYLILTSPHGPSDVRDLGVGLQNQGLGLFTIQAKCEFPIIETLKNRVSVGWLRSPKENPENGESNMGIELGTNFTLDLKGNLSLDFGGAYLFTGDFYRPKGKEKPSNLFEIFTRLQLEF